MTVYIVIECGRYSDKITNIDSVYLTEDGARERLRELGNGHDYIQKVVR